MLRSIRQECEKKPTAKAAVMDQKDIARMKQAAKIETAEDIKQQTLMAQQQRESVMAQSNARKAKIQAMDKERANKVQPTDIEVANR